MKLLKTYAGVAFAIALFLGSCEEIPKKKQNPDAEKMEAKEEIGEPNQIISLADADSLYVNYTKRRANVIYELEAGEQDADGKRFVPTRFVSFSLAAIKEYLKYVEQESAKAGVKPDSLRIYLGNYGKQLKKKKDINHNTVFLLPAAKTKAGYGGIYIGENGKAKLIRNYFKSGEESDGGEPKSEASFMPSFNSSLMQVGSKSFIFNRGDGGPPPTGDF